MRQLKCFKIKQLFTILIILFLFGQLNAVTVNLYISPPRGGFGDTAANLLMIERLKEYYKDSNIKFNVVVSIPASTQVATLWPEFDRFKNKQTIRGLDFYLETKKPKSDFLVSFSGYPNSTYPDFNSQHSITYTEYSERNDRSNHQLRQEVLRTNVFTGSFLAHIDDEFKYSTINTGFPFGLYVLEDFRPEDQNLTLTLNSVEMFLFQQQSKSNKKNQIISTPTIVGSFSDFSEFRDLGYAYSSSPELTEQYVRAALRFSKLHNKKTLIVVNHPVTLPENEFVTVLYSKNIPFDLAQKLVKSATIPVLVTGDGSLSLAIEGNKPFLYSEYAWKALSINQMLKEFEKKSKYLNLNESARNQLTRMLSLDLSGFTDYENDFFDFFNNSQLQNEVKKVLKTISKEQSLVKKVSRDIMLFGLIDSKVTFKASLHLLFQAARESKDIPSFIQTLQENIHHRFYTPQERILFFMGLASIKKVSRALVLEQFEKILFGEDLQLSRALMTLMNLNADNQFFLKLTLDSNTKVKMKVLEIFANLAVQDRFQNGEHNSQFAIQSMLTIIDSLTSKEKSLPFIEKLTGRFKNDILLSSNGNKIMCKLNYDKKRSKIR